MLLRGSKVCSRLVVPLSEPTTFRAGYAMSPLLDFRRQNIRKQWRAPTPPDAEFEIFPNERLGRQYDLNWEFNAYQVTPCEEAFRNLHLRGLQMLAPSKIDKNKSINLTTEEPSDHEIYFLPSSKLTGEVNTVSNEAWKTAIRQVRARLSFEPQIFMHDGALGSSRNSPKARLMFNDVNCALQLHHSLSKVPLREPKKFAHDITGWMLDVNDLEFPRESFGIKSDNFTLVDVDTRRFITVGALTQNVIRKSLVAAAGDYASEKESLWLNCDTVVNGEQTGLVFPIDNAPLASEKGDVNLYSASNTVWGPSGLSRVWDSVSLDHVPSTATKGDIIEKIGNSTRFTSRLPNTFGAVAPHPKFALFVKEGADSVSNLTAEKAKELLMGDASVGSSPVANKEEFASRFDQLMAENSTECFLVNTKNAANLASIIKDAFQGKATASSNSSKAANTSKSATSSKSSAKKANKTKAKK